MNNYFKKLKEWLVLWIWFLIAFSIWTFAYSKIETVKTGDVLSADSYNEIINTLNEYGSSIKDLKTQNEWIYQNAFDTNEIWTGRYDAPTGKKIYSRWVNFGEFSWAWATRAHGIEWIEKIIFAEKIFKKNWTEEILEEWYNLWLYINTENIKLITGGNWSLYRWWFRIEYTKIND